MDKILKDMLAQRNYEVEQINKSYNNIINSNDSQVDNWLKPQETSLKSEKFQEIKSEEPQNYSRFKFLNEIEPGLSNINPTAKKNVSFNNKDQVNTFNSEPFSEEEEQNSLFSKLKKINKKEENITLKIQEKDFNEEDRLTKLERNMKNLDEKMDKIIALLSSK